MRRTWEWGCKEERGLNSVKDNGERGQPLRTRWSWRLFAARWRVGVNREGCHQAGPGLGSQDDFASPPFRRTFVRRSMKHQNGLIDIMRFSG
eukprot:jgi/Chlat1/9279/Chrsp99S08542